jgi:hypothetical protein
MHVWLPAPEPPTTLEHTPGIALPVTLRSFGADAPAERPGRRVMARDDIMLDELWMSCGWALLQLASNGNTGQVLDLWRRTGRTEGPLVNQSCWCDIVCDLPNRMALHEQ